MKITNPLFRLMKFRCKKEVRKFKSPAGIEMLMFNAAGYKGADVPCILLQPEKHTEKTPCLIYYHGGGFIFPLAGSTLHNACTYIEKTGCRVLLPEYRLAPEYVFPVQTEEAYSVLCYAAAHSEELGIDPASIAVLGDSAGGTLAASVTHMSKDRNGPEICFQMLLYPALDHTGSTRSMTIYSDAVISADFIKQMWELYLKNGNNGPPGYAAPLHSEDFKNIPPAYIEPQEMDCLCDEAVLYAEKLGAAGIETELNMIKGSYHGFDMELENPFVKRIMEHRCRVLNKAFSVTEM